MSGFLSTYAGEKILDQVFNNTNWAALSSVYMALFSDNPTPDDAGTEIAGGSYAREEISFGAVASATTSNDTDLQFAGMPDTNAAPVTHFGIYDASTSGNLIAYGSLPSSIPTNSGDTVDFDTGSISISAVTE